MGMRNRISFVVLCVVLIGAAGAVQSAPPAAADEVIAITKAQWAAEIRGDTAAAMRSIADDYSEFNPDYPTRLDGKALATKFAEANAGSSAKTVAGDMANARVQLYGDVAILTYNYVGAIKDKDGNVTPNAAKSTRVYVKQGGEWKLVHANFAPVGAN